MFNGDTLYASSTVLALRVSTPIRERHREGENCGVNQGTEVLRLERSVMVPTRAAVAATSSALFGPESDPYISHEASRTGMALTPRHPTFYILSYTIQGPCMLRARMSVARLRGEVDRWSETSE